MVKPTASAAPTPTSGDAWRSPSRSSRGFPAGRLRRCAGCQRPSLKIYGQKHRQPLPMLRPPARPATAGSTPPPAGPPSPPRPNKSQQEIAEQIGCSQGTVSKAMADNIPRNIIPPTRTDSLGRTRPTSYAKRKPAPARRRAGVFCAIIRLLTGLDFMVASAPSFEGRVDTLLSTRTECKHLTSCQRGKNPQNAVSIKRALKKGGLTQS